VRASWRDSRSSSALGSVPESEEAEDDDDAGDAVGPGRTRGWDGDSTDKVDWGAHAAVQTAHTIPIRRRHVEVASVGLEVGCNGHLVGTVRAEESIASLVVANPIGQETAERPHGSLGTIGRFFNHVLCSVVSAPPSQLPAAAQVLAGRQHLWGFSAGVFVAGFCAFLQLYATQPLLALLRRVFAASEGEVTLTVSAATLAVAVASPFVGASSDAIGRKRVIVPCLVAIALSTFCCGTARSLPALVAWRFVGGVFTPGVIAVTIAMIGEEAPEGTAVWVTSIYVTGTVVGGLTGRLLAAFVADTLSWRASFFVLAATTAVGAIGTQLLLPRSTRFERQTAWHQTLGSFVGHVRNPRLLATCFVGFSVLFCHVGLFTYATFRLAAPPYSLSTSALGYVFFVYALGLLVTPAAGAMVDRIGHRAGMSIAASAVLVGALLTIAPNLASFIVGLAVASSGVFVAQASASSHVGSAANGAHSAASGLYVACYYLGGSFGATALVLPWRIGGWSAVVACIAGVQVGVVLVARRYFASPDAAS